MSRRRLLSLHADAPPRLAAPIHSGLVSQQVPGLAAEHLAQRRERAESDGPGPAVLEYRQVHDRDAYSVRQFRQRHCALAEQFVETDSDRSGISSVTVRLVVMPRGELAVASASGHHTVPLSSSSMTEAARVIRPNVSSAAPASAGTGKSALTGARRTSANVPLTSNVDGVISFAVSTSAPRWLRAAATTLPAITTQPSWCRMLAARVVNGPLRPASVINRQISSSTAAHRTRPGSLVSKYRLHWPTLGCSAHARMSPPGRRTAPGKATSPCMVP